MAHPPRREIYMSIPAANADKEESFEETRVLDYLHAYRTTGKPPGPCPQTPTNAAERTALGLPPLFEPHSELFTYPTDQDTMASSRQLITTVPLPVPGAMSDAHAFRATRGDPSIGDGNTFYQSITVQPEFKGFSFEELRAAAYRAGRKFVQSPAPPQAASPVSPQASYAPQINGAGAQEKFQSISCLPPYSKHSFEELRLAFVRSGVPLSSADIIQRNASLRLA